MTFRTFDTVKTILKKVNDDRLGDEWFTNERSVEVLKHYCDILDEVIQEQDGICFGVEVQEDLSISLMVETKNFTVDDSYKDHKLYELMSRALAIKFRCNEGETLITEFIFPGVWDMKRKEKQYE